MNMNACSRLLKILLVFGTLGSSVHTNAEEEKHLVMLVPQHHISRQAGRRLRGARPFRNPQNEVTTTSSSSGESQSTTTPSARGLNPSPEASCTVDGSLDSLLEAVEDSECTEIFVLDQVLFSSDFVLDGRNKTLKPSSNNTNGFFELLEVTGPGQVNVEIRNLNIDGDKRAVVGVSASGSDAFLSIVSCNITNFISMGVYGSAHAGLKVTDSYIFGNRMVGVSVQDSAEVVVRGSTIYNNRFGISCAFAKAFVVQSTISKHRHAAIFAFGAVDSNVDVTVSHSTLVSERNSDGEFALVFAEDGASISLDNSILVVPSNDTCDALGEDSKVIDGGFNAIQGSEYPSCLDVQNSNVTDNTTIVSDNLRLGDLEDNGGPTLTHALLEGSPAIDAGNCTSFVDQQEAFDQRGVVRPQGSGCDIGAYEFEVTAALVIIEANGGKQCINGNARKQPITISKQVDSTFDATKVVDNSIVVPGYQVFQTQVKEGDLFVLLEKDNTQDQNVVAGTMIDVTGELLDGTVFVGTLSICP